MVDNVTSNPNEPDDEQYIVQLIERVTTVSLETLALIRALAGRGEARFHRSGSKAQAQHVPVARHLSGATGTLVGREHFPPTGGTLGGFRRPRMGKSG